MDTPPVSPKLLNVALELSLEFGPAWRQPIHVKEVTGGVGAPVAASNVRITTPARGDRDPHTWPTLSWRGSDALPNGGRARVNRKASRSSRAAIAVLPRGHREPGRRASRPSRVWIALAEREGRNPSEPGSRWPKERHACLSRWDLDAHTKALLSSHVGIAILSCEDRHPETWPLPS